LKIHPVDVYGSRKNIVLEENAEFQTETDDVVFSAIMIENDKQMWDKHF